MINRHQAQQKKFIIRDSIIRRTTREAVKYDAINLGQGFPNERPCDQMAVAAALGILCGSREAVEDAFESSIDNSTLSLKDHLLRIQKAPSDVLNQYTFPFGTPQLRQKIADYYRSVYNCHIDIDTEITVTLGATEGVSVVLRSIAGPGNAVVIIQPYHEMYLNQALVFGIHPIVVSLYDCSNDPSIHSTRASDLWKLNFDEIEKAIDDSEIPVKGLILNSPHNPTGKVFSYDELRKISEICLKRGIYIITDEIYEHIIFGGRFDSIPGPHQTLLWNWGHEFRANTLIVNSVSKTGSATGWRVGWVLSPKHLTETVRAIHDNMAMQAPTPLQFASERLLERELSFFTDELPLVYKAKVELVEEALRDVGFTFACPDGAYYIFASYYKIPVLSELNSTEAAQYLTENVGVAVVPGDAFLDVDCLPNGQTGKYLRFAFCKTKPILLEGMRRLKEWKNNGYVPIHACKQNGF